MRPGKRCLVVVVSIACLQLSACQRESSSQSKAEPALVEHIEGTERSRVIVSAQAMERLGIETAPVRETQIARKRMVEREVTPMGSGTVRTVIPYSAVVYDARRHAFVYTSPKPRTFVRHHITVDYIEGDLAVLSDGPPDGTEVVIAGAYELFGTEF